MKKTTVKKGAKKRNVSKKVVKRTASKAKVCATPTTLFEVEFPTVVLFWIGVALFFLFLLMISQVI